MSPSFRFKIDHWKAAGNEGASLLFSHQAKLAFWR